MVILAVELQQFGLEEIGGSTAPYALSENAGVILVADGDNNWNVVGAFTRPGFGVLIQYNATTSGGAITGLEALLYYTTGDVDLPASTTTVSGRMAEMLQLCYENGWCGVYLETAAISALASAKSR